MQKCKPAVQPIAVSDPGTQEVSEAAPHLTLATSPRRGRRIDTDALSDVLAGAGAEQLLSVAGMLTEAQADFDQLCQDAGVTVIQAALKASVNELLGPKRPGHTRDGGLVRFGSQRGVVRLSDRNVRIKRPRVRRQLADGTSVEEPLPAYQALRHDAAGRRVSDIVIHGVSTRNYQQMIGDTADAVGISRSSISREHMREAEAKLQELLERPLDDLNILVVTIDGIIVAGTHVLIAIGISDTGVKHVLGLREGASEHASVVTPLLEDIVARGLDPAEPRLFVIDGSKALRCAVRRVFGEAPVQRCRLHKIRNVCDQLPDEQAALTRSVMNAAFSMKPKAGVAKLTEHAGWLKREYPSAARSLTEGLQEMFTVNRLDLPPRLARSLCSTNMIESPNSAVRRAIGRVTRWRGGEMVLRWVGHALSDAEHTWRVIAGHTYLWILKQNLTRTTEEQEDQATPAA